MINNDLIKNIYKTLDNDEHIKIANILNDKKYINIIEKNIFTYQDITNLRLFLNNVLGYELKFIGLKKYENISYEPKVVHIGQRKLLLSEIKFIHENINFNSKNNKLLIYIGSAPCIHFPLILDMYDYDNLKFILIDPNYHIFDYKFKYIYQHKDIVLSDPEYHKKYFSISKNNKSNDLYKVDFTNKENHNVIENLEKSYGLDDFYNMINKNFINDLFKDESRAFVIQDYLTIPLLKTFKKYLLNSNNVDLYIISDIRTEFFNANDIMNDVNIIHNNCLQGLMHMKLKPLKTMFKFRIPFYYQLDNNYIDNIDTQNEKKIMLQMHKIIIDKINNNNNNKDMVMNMISDDIIMFYKKLCKNNDELSEIIDNIFLNGKYVYLYNDGINVQQWNPYKSSESRFIIANDKNKIRIYDYNEWYLNYYLLNIYKAFSYINKNDNVLDYCGCYNCRAELNIFNNYLNSNHNKLKMNIIDINNTLSKYLRSINKMKYNHTFIKYIYKLDIKYKESYIYFYDVVYKKIILLIECENYNEIYGKDKIPQYVMTQFYSYIINKYIL